MATSETAITCAIALCLMACAGDTRLHGETGDSQSGELVSAACGRIDADPPGLGQVDAYVCEAHTRVPAEPPDLKVVVVNHGIHGIAVVNQAQGCGSEARYFRVRGQVQDEEVIVPEDSSCGLRSKTCACLIRGGSEDDDCWACPICAAVHPRIFLAPGARREFLWPALGWVASRPVETCLQEWADGECLRATILPRGAYTLTAYAQTWPGATPCDLEDPSCAFYPGADQVWPLETYRVATDSYDGQCPSVELVFR